MPTPSRKGILLVLLAIFLVISVSVIPDIISDKMQAWCLAYLGEGYQKYLLGVFVLGSVGVLFLTTDILKYLSPGAKPGKPDRYNIPPGPTTRRLLGLAKTAIAQADPGQALRHLADLKIPALNAEIDLLSSRLADYQRTKRHGVDAPDEENRTFNRITRDIRDLITALENELAEGDKNDQTIKEYLKKRYTNRLGQKLANRQPVNLRRLVNTDVVPEAMSPAFVPYSSEEISGALLQTFREARGRLLLVGVPGAGKTTLMLQLVLELLESEPGALPVLLNLATWSKEFTTLEAWLKKILPAETGTSDRYAAELIRQNRLILLFDGFDEIREEDRLSCLEAINRYGEESQRQYAISSRKQEFKEVNKAVLVHLPIEVCPLTLEQMKAELLRLWENPDKPERGAKLLLDAIEKDTLLREVVQTPFYFNTLQILFNGGLTVAELQFVTGSIEGRQSEIKERFVEYELKAHIEEYYPTEKVSHWLSFLGSRMIQRNMVVFELRDLQYNWWRWGQWQLLLARSVPQLFAELNNGQPLIKTKDSINLSWNNFFKNLKKNFIYCLDKGLRIGLILGLVSGLFEVMPYVTIGKQSDVRIGELKFLLFFVMFMGLLIWLAVWLSNSLEDLLKNSSDFLQITSPYQRFNASMKSLHFSILQHKFLCYQLRKQGLLPPDLVKFLNEMSLRHILEFDGDPVTGKGGGSWRFRHRILQEYFAERWVEPGENKSNPQ